MNFNEDIELNDGYGSYICKYGHVHNYKKNVLKEEREGKTYNTAKEMMEDIFKND